MNSKPRTFQAAPSGRVRPRRRLNPVWPAVLLWAALMTPLLRWGLPSRAEDGLLFGGEPAWDAARYDATRTLQERQQRQAGADTDLNPLPTRDRIVCLTPDDAARAEILRRYRLFSRQPDEMITFMGLQRMRPPHFGVDPDSHRRVLRFDLDPGLYQYGGGYVYLVGAALAATALAGLTRLTSDVNVYLAQPELFAAFYVVARALSLVCGALLLAAAWKLARRAAGQRAGWLALLLVACTPVFITGVLEAKPHVPAACLALWATLSALDYAGRGRGRAALRMGLQAGCALGLVLTGIVALALWPVLYAVRRRAASRGGEPGHPGRHLLAAAGIALAVYVLTNPYVPYNFLFQRAVVASNIGNSIAMYTGQMSQALAGAARVGALLMESGGLAVIVLGLAGLIVWLRRRPGETVLAASAGLAVLLVAVLLGAGKPAEYARFLVLPVSLLCVATACLTAAVAQRKLVLGLILAVLAFLPMGTIAYVRAFATDAGLTNESRHQAGLYVREHARPSDGIGVLQEPAPYAVPPLDFAQRQVYWLPPRKPQRLPEAALPQWLVFSADDESVNRGAWWAPYYELAACFPAPDKPLARIAWANKPAFVLVRRTPPTTASGPALPDATAAPAVGPGE